jgi:hypothetical protein
MLWLFLLLLVTAIVAYVLMLRSLLHKLPLLAGFYARANGFWAKVWALFGRSATVAWGYLVAASATVMQALSELARVLGDPSLDLKSQLIEILKDYPAAVSGIGIAFGLITITVRLRTIGRSA